MKKIGVFLIALILISISLIGLISAARCTIYGYTNKYGHYADDKCTAEITGDTRCESSPRPSNWYCNCRSCCNADGSCRYWYYHRNIGGYGSCSLGSNYCPSPQYSSPYCGSNELGYIYRRDFNYCSGSSCRYTGWYVVRYADWDSYCCVSQTCADIGKECSSWVEPKCGRTLNCDAQIGCDSGEQCYDGSCNLLTDAQWTDMNGVTINNADEEDTVLMKVEGQNLDSTTINYTIFEEDTWFFGLDKFWNEINITETIGYQSLVVEEGTFMFLAKVLGDIFGEKESGNLEVYEGGGGEYEDNNKPNATITAPYEGYEISTGAEVTFTQLSKDEDDLLKITWDFADGNTETYEDYAFGRNPDSADTTHSFADAGHYNVKLTAKEMDRDKLDYDFVGVEVFGEGVYVVPVISEPLGGVGYGHIVDFDASQSYVSNCTFDACPAGESCFTIEGGLNCYYIHAPGSRDTPNYMLLLNWTFVGSNRVETLSGYWSTPTDEYDKVVEFSNFFTDAGEHSATLKIIYEEIPSGP